MFSGVCMGMHSAEGAVAAATLVIISDGVTHTIEVVHCDEW